MEKLTSPLIGLSFLQRNNTVLDMRQGVLNFPFLSMQLKTADHKYTNVMEPICIGEDVTIPPNDRHSVLMASQLYQNTTVFGILQPSNNITDDGNFAFCAALFTLTNDQVSIHLNNFTDSPYTLKRGTGCYFHCPNTRTDEICQAHRPCHHMANPENAAYYASSLIKSTKPGDVKENNWFPTPEDPEDPQHHTPIQKRIFSAHQSPRIRETQSSR